MLPVLLTPAKYFCYTKNGLINVPKIGHTDSVHTVLCLLSPMLCVKCFNIFVSFCHEEMLSLSFNSQEERPPTLGCPQLFVQYSRSYSPFRKGYLLHPQPEDGPRWGQSGNLKYLSCCAQYAVWPTYTVYISQGLYFSHISRNVRTAGHLNVRALLLFKNQQQLGHDVTQHHITPLETQ